MSDHDLASRLLGNAGEDSGCDGRLRASRSTSRAS